MREVTYLFIIFRIVNYLTVKNNHLCKYIIQLNHLIGNCKIYIYIIEMMLKLKRMDYIKLFIGLKVNLKMRMVLKKLKDGLLIKNMLVIGKII